MQIPKNASAAIIVNREWANLVGVRIFLRHYQNQSKEIGGTDSSHLIQAKLLDAEDDRGLWIELFTEQHKQDPSTKRLSMMIPWNSIISLVLSEEWTPAIQEEMRKVGFSR